MSHPAIVSTASLATPWRGADPFLFMAHHLDLYPQGDGALAPAATLDGRQPGSDFANKDGWNMYHGERVPGFPAHPHRGFETITIVPQGYVDHADSLGAAFGLEGLPNGSTWFDCAEAVPGYSEPSTVDTARTRTVYFVELFTPLVMSPPFQLVQPPPLSEY